MQYKFSPVIWSESKDIDVRCGSEVDCPLLTLGGLLQELRDWATTLPEEGQHEVAAMMIERVEGWIAPYIHKDAGD